MAQLATAHEVVVTLRISAITYWILLIQGDHPQVATTRAVFRSTLPLSNATCAPNDLHELTTYDHTYARIPTSDHSYVLCAAKRLHANMTEKDTKAFTLAKRNLCARAPFNPDHNGDAVDALHEPMPWVVTSDLKPVASALSPFWRRKPPNDNEHGWKSSNKLR